MYRVYQVQFGDTIENISQRVGITTQELMSLNDINEIEVGQLLVVPNQNNLFDMYVVVKGDNIYEIARNNNVGYEELLKINGLDKDDYIYPGQQILIPKNNISLYVTNENETLSDVANKLGISEMELIENNKTIYLFPEQLIIYRK